MMARAPITPDDPVKPKWFLGFDCATKSLAFSLSRIDLDGFNMLKQHIRTRTQVAFEIVRRAQELIAVDPAKAASLYNSVSTLAADLDRESKSFLRLVDGEAVDLFPGKPDAEIATVERLRAVSRYVKERIHPAIQKAVPASQPLQVVIEFQMGPNAPARAVAAALITLFAEEDVVIVGPTLKNKISTCEAGRYCYFAEKYSTAYGANKAHAKFNFARIEDTFGTEIPDMDPPALRGHIADSFMQILGLLVHGPAKNAASYF